MKKNSRDFTKKMLKFLAVFVLVFVSLVFADMKAGAFLSWNRSVEIEIEPLKNSLPGKYEVKISLEDDGVVYDFSESFMWGVLAVNFNKSIYLSDEEVYVQMAVLNESGHTICDADLQVEISDPDGEIKSFLTQDDSIEKSDTCGSDNVTDEPDYFFHYQTGEKGTYEMKLTNLDTQVEVIDSFEVKKEIDFEVERIGATRINPFKSKYRMSLEIKANKDFQGSIVETVPEEFKISEEERLENTDFSVFDEDEAKKIEWKDMQLKEGEELELSYEYQAPKESPMLFLLGPLRMISKVQDKGIWSSLFLSEEDESIVFEETRQWQLASDTTFDDKDQILDSSANPVIKNYTCGATATLLVLSIMTDGGNRSGTPTYGVTNFTQAGTTESSAEGTAELWYLLAPTVSSSLSVSVPNPNTNPVTVNISSYISSTGASAFHATNQASGVSTNPTVSVNTSENSCVIVDACFMGYRNAATGNNRQLLYVNDTGQEGNGSQYYLQASAANEAMSWTQSSDDWAIVAAAFKEISLPTVATQAVSAIGGTTATGNGNITNTGGENNDIRGFVYDEATQSAPGNVAPGSSGYANFAQDSGSYGTGAFTKTLISLSIGTTYYVRAYSHNSVGYDYGNEVSFTTNNSPSVVLYSPDDTATISDTTPTFEFTGTDANSDDIRYNIQVDTVNTFDSQGVAIMDSYSESNHSDDYILYNVIPKLAQSFTADGNNIASCKFYLKKTGLPTGNAAAVLYAHSGTYGIDSEPTDSALATSGAFDVSTLSGSHQLVEFTFGAPYTTTDGTKYCIAIEYSGGDGSNYVNVGEDNNGSTHSGNFAFFGGGSWAHDQTRDMIFYVYSKDALLNKVSGTDAGFANVDTPADPEPYNSGDKCDYDVQAGDALSVGTYYWRVSGKDPTGSNTYGAWATTRSFTVSTSIISITISDAEVLYGTVATSADTTGGEGDTQTVTNNGDVAEDFDIKGQNSANWTLGASAGDAIYKHAWCTSDCDGTPTWNALTTTYDSNYLATNIASLGTQDFDLQVTVPTSNAGTSSQNVSVFILATQH